MRHYKSTVRSVNVSYGISMLDTPDGVVSPDGESGWEVAIASQSNGPWRYAGDLNPNQEVIDFYLEWQQEPNEADPRVEQCLAYLRVNLLLETTPAAPGIRARRF